MEELTKKDIPGAITTEKRINRLGDNVSESHASITELYDMVSTLTERISLMEKRHTFRRSIFGMLFFRK